MLTCYPNNGAGFGVSRGAYRCMMRKGNSNEAQQLIYVIRVRQKFTEVSIMTVIDLSQSRTQRFGNHTQSFDWDILTQNQSR